MSERSYRPGLRVMERDRVLSVGDGVVWIEGLPSARMDGLLVTEEGSEALIFHLAADRLGAIVLDRGDRIRVGSQASLLEAGLTVPHTDTLLGRVVDPLCHPLDGGTPISCEHRWTMDGPSARIVDRDFVDQPLYTGNKIVDSLIPIGKGQRQLLIGDNGTGKSALALDTVIAQRGKNVRCVYVLIGQKRSAVLQTLAAVKAHDALAFTTLVVAEATASAGIKYLAPFAGCAIAESWMHDGHDTLVVYDDLTTHAQAYRELSLLLRRPPGREAYPADIFYLQARLLERSTHLSAARGGGSMTALPIAETEQGEIAAYIPTNLISITDGQIRFDTGLFARGVLPAIDIALSVSRIGGKAQHPAIKREAGRSKLDYLQFLELEIFSRFGARPDETMQAHLRRGQALRHVLQQDRLDPLGPTAHLAWLIAANDGWLDTLSTGEREEALGRLRALADDAALTLDTPRPTWAERVRLCVQGAKVAS